MAFKFPFSTLHELNLDWILSKVKELLENNEEFNDKADTAVATAEDAKDIAEDAKDIAEDAQGTADAATDLINDLINEFEIEQNNFVIDDPDSVLSTQFINYYRKFGKLVVAYISNTYSVPADGEFHQFATIPESINATAGIEFTTVTQIYGSPITYRISNTRRGLFVKNSTENVIDDANSCFLIWITA